MHDAFSRKSGVAETPQEKLFRWLSKLQPPTVLWQVIIAALVLASPSVFTGFVADDYILEYELHGPKDNEWPGTPPWDLYRLMDPPHVERMRDGNGAPWWFYKGASCRFLRPISGLTHLLDDQLAPLSALLPHVHSLLWLGLLLVSVAWAYRSIVELSWVAAVSGAMFALDSGHAVTLSWIVNRSSFVAAFFGVLSLAFHHRYRRGGRAGLGVLASLSFSCALFSAELALGIVGYLAAYALFMERGTWVRRAMTLWPYVPTLLLWVVVRQLGGYGTEGWNVYVDPVREPGLFLRNLPERVAMLLASQTTRLNSDMHDLLPPEQQPWFVLAAVLCCAGAAYFVWPVLRTRAEARFWAAGAVAAVLPMCAAQPSDRLLTLVGLGVMPVLAYAMHDTLTKLGSSGARTTLAGVYSFLHLAVSPLMLPLLALGAAIVGSVIDRTEATLPSNAGVVDQTVIVASVPDSLLIGFLPIMRSVNGTPRPRRLYWLAATREPVTFERIGDASLRVTPAQGFYDQPQESRARLHPLEAGQRIELTDMSATVLKLNADGRPASAEFEFKQALSSPEYVWLTWRDGQLEPWVPPAVGEAKTLPAVSDLL